MRKKSTLLLLLLMAGCRLISPPYEGWQAPPFPASEIAELDRLAEEIEAMASGACAVNPAAPAVIVCPDCGCQFVLGAEKDKPEIEPEPEPKPFMLERRPDKSSL